MTTTIIIMDEFPPLPTCPPGTILGYHHYRTPKGEVLIPRRHVRYWEGRSDTETRFVREWINTLPKIRRQRETVLVSRAAQPPLFVKVGGIHEAVYIDLTAAYPSIWQRVGWEVEYMRGAYFSVNTPPIKFPFPMSWKVGRSLPVSSMPEGWSRIWTGRGIKIKKFLNRSFNPSIRLATLDILQAVATVAVRAFGAIYYNTDGAIIPAIHAPTYGAFLRGVGLDFKVKGQGHAYAVGMHSVNIGGRQIGSGMATPRPFSNLIFDEKNALDLLDKFSMRRLP